MPTGNPVTLVNRTDSVVKFVADGRHYDLQPGDNHGFLEGHSFFALKQNPVMGTEDYTTVRSDSLVGVKVNGKEHPEFPCSPLSDEVMLGHLDAKERFNRKTTPRQNVEFARTTGISARAAMAGLDPALGVSSR